jgi:hypothetical protein
LKLESFCIDVSVLVEKEICWGIFDPPNGWYEPAVMLRDANPVFGREYWERVVDWWLGLRDYSDDWSTDLSDARMSWFSEKFFIFRF